MGETHSILLRSSDVGSTAPGSGVEAGAPYLPRGHFLSIHGYERSEAREQLVSGGLAYMLAPFLVDSSTRAMTGRFL